MTKFSVYQDEIVTDFSKLLQEFDLYRQEWYGGCYFDENNVFHFQTTDCHVTDREIRSYFRQDIAIDTVKQSRLDLKKRCLQIMQSGNKNIIGIGINEEKNCLSLAVAASAGASASAASASSIETACRTDYPDCQVYTVSEIRLQSDISIASALSNGRCSFSLGYPVVRESAGIRGFITAGHLTGNAQGDSIRHNGGQVGTVYEFESSENMDATFVKTDDPAISDVAAVPAVSAVSAVSAISGKITIKPACKLIGQAPELIQGASVIMYGGVSGKSYAGRLLYPRFDLTAHKNVMVFSYSSEDGDSGSPILLQPSDENGLLVGIHIGTIGMGSKVCSLGYAAADINKRFSLELSL